MYIETRSISNCLLTIRQLNCQCIFLPNMYLENPSFDSQTKETLTTTKAKFGSPCTLGDKFLETRMQLLLCCLLNIFVPISPLLTVMHMLLKDDTLLVISLQMLRNNSTTKVV